MTPGSPSIAVMQAAQDRANSNRTALGLGLVGAR